MTFLYDIKNTMTQKYGLYNGRNKNNLLVSYSAFIHKEQHKTYEIA